MTPKKQVSPAIRILRGERDASARATHLEAVTRKFLVTTNERKQMSTKTNFKRIALVAVAALGLGVLSSVPAKAVGNLAVTVTNGSFTTVLADTTTAATIAISGTLENTADTITVSVVANGTLGESVTVARSAGVRAAYIFPMDTSTSSRSQIGKTSLTLPTNVPQNRFAGSQPYDSQMVATATNFYVLNAATIGNVGATFGIQVDSVSSPAIAGTYSFTVFVKQYTQGVLQPITTSYTASLVVAAAASASTTPAPGFSTAFIGAGSDVATSDVAVSALATASTTPAATIAVRTYNASGTSFPVAESITATISGAGLLSFGSISGSSLVIAGTGTSNISVLPNGVAGNATITISTTSRTFPAKTMTFYSAAPSTLVSSVSAPLAGIGSNLDVVRVDAKDSAGVSWNGQLYIYASAAADALVAGAVRATTASSAITCAVPTATQPLHVCPVNGLAAGTAKFKVSNYATAALATAAASGAEATSNEVTVTVGAAAVASVKIEFDKATYAPGERARIYVTPLDSAGKAMQAATYPNLFASGGISSASALTFAGSTTTADSLTAVSITTAATSSSTSGARAGSALYTVYMPVTGGTVTLSATGGITLPIAARVAITGSATITDSGAAALAAVAALSTTVASLKTLITTLTNLVLKIQKKVKA